MQYYIDESALGDNGAIIGYPSANNKKFLVQFKQKITDKTDAGGKKCFI